MRGETYTPSSGKVSPTRVKDTFDVGGRRTKASTDDAANAKNTKLFNRSCIAIVKL